MTTTNSNSRMIVVLGVLATAALTAGLVIPASRQLGAADGIWLGALILIAPTMVVLVATSFRYYGLRRSIAVAAAVMVITSIVTFIVSVFTFASALSGSMTGLLLSVVLLGVPPLSVSILGLLALRFAGPEAADERHHARTSADGIV